MTALNAEEFDLGAYAARLLAVLESDELEDSPSVRRRALAAEDPLAFAVLYLSHHLRDSATGGRISLSDAHLDWIERARDWRRPLTEPSESRHAEIAPRSMGKSTWFFLILPLWAAAFGYLKFVAAFADSAGQAELHLATFKRELETNATLREDFPELVAPLIRGRGVLASDNRGLYLSASGFAFMAKGIDAGALGMKIGAQRPDLILLDDIEPNESKYSLELVKKRRITITDAILPLSLMARVVIVGTVTMPGSLIHQLVKAGRGVVEEGAEWIQTEKIVSHHYRPILARGDGSERSIWPEKWSLDYLEGIRHTRSFKKNYENDPMGNEGDYWTEEDFIRGLLGGVTRTLLSIDPAVTSKSSSDYTGLAVVGYSPSSKKVLVKEAVAVKLTPAFIRARVAKMIEADPSIGLILVETNQGGDVWREILAGIPVPIRTIHQTVKKEVRAASVLNHYQRGRVVHAVGLAALELQQVAFPEGPNDDLVDAAGAGVAYFLNRKKKAVAGAVSVSYLD